MQLPGAVTCAGSLALVGWFIVYAGAFSTTDFGSSVPIPWTVPLVIHASLLSGFGLGVWLLKTNTRGTLFWWHEVLLCALYLGGTQLLLSALLDAALPMSAPLLPLIKWSGLVDNPPASMLLVWFFPLGAPLLEFLVRHMRLVERELRP